MDRFDYSEYVRRPSHAELRRAADAEAAERDRLPVGDPRLWAWVGGADMQATHWCDPGLPPVKP